MALLVVSDAQNWTVVDDDDSGAVEVSDVLGSPLPAALQPSGLAVEVDSGVRGMTGPRGPAGVVVIEADATTPPPGTPVGTIVYQLIN